ncbi:MAG: glycosyltransferase family 39 protein [Edaphobacter sp.]|uniref:ArnT family glycosyltransferase n=1 Tax=Edaphobacter sp. TaxID=1934404 RepID=UPI00238704A2|nr:glycosyltransferase family 39 protein [Edaphobacter sp.]MDE1176190.1 glycosyltransferase family 39 protein [Edaphobacter sp.]
MKQSSQPETSTTTRADQALRPSVAATATPSAQLWRVRSLAMIFAAWLVLQVGGLFRPGLLDDVDSIYIEIAREMMLRHDYVTPYINGVRFFDKPPLMYWMAAASMHVFGVHDWAARLPLALGVLALLLAVYALGIRLFASVSPAHAPDRGGFYAALAMATSIGPYLYTRFYIPDILLALWMTLAVHLFLIALDRIREGRSALAPSLAFAAVMALNVLTKGLIGLVFPIGFVFFYLLITRRLRLLLRLHLLASMAAFLLIAAPWHILAALRTPAIALPTGLGLPARGGWAWFYLYNEHIARFLGKRIPHDYGQVPIPLFWLLSALWVMPWTAFLFPALSDSLRDLRQRVTADERRREAALSLIVWAGTVLFFFTLSSRQEYYNLPALPALALMAAGLLCRADVPVQGAANAASQSAQRWSLYFLVPFTTVISLISGYFAVVAPHPSPGADIASLLAANPEFYNLSLGHIFDLTGDAMGLFRGPLAVVSISMLAMGPGSYLLRRNRRKFAANMTLAGAMIVTLLAAHEGLARFYPILGSKELAEAINNTGLTANDSIILDGELTSGSSLIFYTKHQVHLINGNVNGLWYGGLWPDAPQIFESEDSLRKLWAGASRVFLLTYAPKKRMQDLSSFGGAHVIAAAGGKTVLANR